MSCSVAHRSTSPLSLRQINNGRRRRTAFNYRNPIQRILFGCIAFGLGDLFTVGCLEAEVVIPVDTFE